MWKIWLIIAGIFLIIESATTGFLVFWFSVGALIALVFSFFVESVVTQTSIFLISSTILIFATRKFCNKFLKNDTPETINTIVGKIGTVTVDIDPIKAIGQVKIGSETWSATSESPIKKGAEIIVEKVDGVKAVVKLNQ